MKMKLNQYILKKNNFHIAFLLTLLVWVPYKSKDDK